MNHTNIQIVNFNEPPRRPQTVGGPAPHTEEAIEYLADELRSGRLNFRTGDLEIEILLVTPGLGMFCGCHSGEDVSAALFVAPDQDAENDLAPKIPAFIQDVVNRLKDPPKSYLRIEMPPHPYCLLVFQPPPVGEHQRLEVFAITLSFAFARLSKHERQKLQKSMNFRRGSGFQNLN